MKTSTIAVFVIVVIVSTIAIIISKDILINVLLILGGLSLVFGLHIQGKPQETEIKNDLKQFDITDENIKECPVCNTKNNINRTYCRQCNTYIKNIVCPVCEHKNPFDQKYCQECDSILQNKTRY